MKQGNSCLALQSTDYRRRDTETSSASMILLSILSRILDAIIISLREEEKSASAPTPFPQSVSTIRDLLNKHAPKVKILWVPSHIGIEGNVFRINYSKLQPH